MNPALNELLERLAAPDDIARQCADLPRKRQHALANLLRFEVSGGDGFALRDRHEADLYQFNYATNELAARLLSLLDPPLRQGTSQLFGVPNVGPEIATLRRNGYLLPDRLLPADAMSRIYDDLARVSFYEKAPADRLLNGAQLAELAHAGHRSESGTFWLNEQNDAVHEPALLALAFDPYILSVAAGYLGCTPIHVQTNAWYSFAGSGAPRQLSASAQLYHQDKEFTKFLKVFVYLNDVGPENGPHSYIEGSHIDELFTRGVPFSTRLTDEQARKHFSADRFRTVTGPAGTIIFGDTSCVHKGWPVSNGHRVMLQFEYAASLYLSPIMPFTNVTLPVPARMLQNHDTAARNRFRAMMENRKPDGVGKRILNRLRRHALSLAS